MNAMTQLRRFAFVLVCTLSAVSGEQLFAMGETKDEIISLLGPATITTANSLAYVRAEYMYEITFQNDKAGVFFLYRRRDSKHANEPLEADVMASFMNDVAARNMVLVPVPVVNLNIPNRTDISMWKSQDGSSAAEYRLTTIGRNLNYFLTVSNLAIFK
jgi:hypothetical protein